MLKRVTAACAQHLIESPGDGRIKLYLTWRGADIPARMRTAFP